MLPLNAVSVPFTSMLLAVKWGVLLLPKRVVTPAMVWLAGPNTPVKEPDSVRLPVPALFTVL